jgi:hypothetical protein
MRFTQTSSVWINQVERWLGFNTYELIRRGSRTSVQALETDIRAYTKGWKSFEGPGAGVDDPRPFIWAKPAERRLESIGRLLMRVSSAAH